MTCFLYLQIIFAPVLLTRQSLYQLGTHWQSIPRWWITRTGHARWSYSITLSRFLLMQIGSRCSDVMDCKYSLPVTSITQGDQIAPSTAGALLQLVCLQQLLYTSTHWQCHQSAASTSWKPKSSSWVEIVKLCPQSLLSAYYPGSAVAQHAPFTFWWSKLLHRYMTITTQAYVQQAYIAGLK